MSAKDNVITLWKEKRPDIKSVAELERKIDLSNGIISKWDTKRPSTKSAQKVADFFKVPLSEILDDVSDKSVSLDEEDQKVLAMFRKQTEGMSERDKKDFQESLNDIMSFAKKLVQNRKDKN
ncbi:MAG: helix-turn-helix transcriptional regulator [Lactobacillus sp.]|nr:helix-turn-helix transcriptional regulator [Lactobacillus sp.]